MAPVIYGILPSPPTRSVIVTAKIIGLDFTLKKVDIIKGDHKSAEYLKISPAHSIPAFVDDDGFQLFDSHSIVTYIVDKYAKDDKLYPKNPKERALVNSMLHFDNGSLWSSILVHFGAQMFGKQTDADREALFKDRMTTLDRILSERPYAAGNHLTVADICIVNSLTAPPSDQFNIKDYPNVAKWNEKLKKELPYYDEVVTKGAEELKEFAKLVTEAIKAKRAAV